MKPNDKPRLRYDDPNLVNLFRAHCEAGWSRRSFVGKMYLTEKGFARAMKENAEFRKVFDQYKVERTTPYKGLVYARKSRRRPTHGSTVESPGETQRPTARLGKPAL